MLFVMASAETTILRLYIMLVVTCSSTVFALNGHDVAVLIEVITVTWAARLLASGCPFSKDEKPKCGKGADKKEPMKHQSKS